MLLNLSLILIINEINNSFLYILFFNKNAANLHLVNININYNLLQLKLITHWDDKNINIFSNKNKNFLP